MAQQAADEKTESQITNEANDSTQRSDTFTKVSAQIDHRNAFAKVRALIEQRERELLKSVNALDSATVSVQFDMDAFQNVMYFFVFINNFGIVEVTENTDPESKEDVVDNDNEIESVLIVESDIITAKEEISRLNGVLISKFGDKSSGNITLSLLHRSTEDDSKEAFHSKCDDQGATVILVHTEHDHVFGCYTSVPWSSERGYHSDDTAFMFSLRTQFEDQEVPKMYTIQTEKYKAKAVYHNGDWGPAFGHGQDFGINWQKTEDSYISTPWIKSGYSYMLDGNAVIGGEQFEDLNRKKKYSFKYKCYEVFAVKTV